MVKENSIAFFDASALIVGEREREWLYIYIYTPCWVYSSPV